MAQPFADNGLILCTVIDSDDPEGLGNVRVQYPDFANQPSTWAPVSTWMASDAAGTWYRPTPGDQVIVAFERGYPRFPAAIGRAHVSTPVTNTQLVCRLLLEKNKKTTVSTSRLQ